MVVFRVSTEPYSPTDVCSLHTQPKFFVTWPQAYFSLRRAISVELRKSCPPSSKEKHECISPGVNGPLCFSGGIRDRRNSQPTAWSRQYPAPASFLCPLPSPQDTNPEMCPAPMGRNQAGAVGFSLGVYVFCLFVFKREILKKTTPTVTSESAVSGHYLWLVWYPEKASGMLTKTHTQGSLLASETETPTLPGQDRTEVNLDHPVRHPPPTHTHGGG